MARCRSACVARFGRAQHRDRAGDPQGHAGGRSNRQKGTWWCPTLWPAFAVQPVLGGCISHSQRHRIGSTSREEPRAPGAIPTGEIREHTGLSRNIDTIGPSLKTGPGSPIRCGQCLTLAKGQTGPSGQRPASEALGLRHRSNNRVALGYVPSEVGSAEILPSQAGLSSLQQVSDALLS